jgi:hypothetical protein
VCDVGRGNLAIIKLLALKNFGPFLRSTYYWMSCSTFLGGGALLRPWIDGFLQQAPAINGSVTTFVNTRGLVCSFDQRNSTPLFSTGTAWELNRVVYRMDIFQSVSVSISWYFIPIPKEISVGTFWYHFFGENPFFPQKGGTGPLFEGKRGHQPPFQYSQPPFCGKKESLPN